MKLRPRIYFRKSHLVGVLLSIFISVSSHAQEIESFDHLKKRYKEAQHLLMDPVYELNSKYIEALKKLLEKESNAGELDSSLEIKHEIEGFGDGKDFKREAFADRESDHFELKRLRETYIDQRDTIWKRLEDKRRQLKTAYLKKLEAFSKEQTRQQNFDAALAATKEKERIEGELNIKRRSSGSFEGVIRFIVKGEIDLWHNGERLGFRDRSDGEHYLIGKSRPAEFKDGDLIQIKVSSNAIFRSIIMLLESEGKSQYLAFETDDYRIGNSNHVDSEVSWEEVNAIQKRPGSGPVDDDMAEIWNDLEVPEQVRAAAHWTKVEIKASPNYYIIILDMDKVIEVSE